jgi:hypothetical protein
VTWREGSNTRLASRFAAVRVRPAHRDYERDMPRPEEWCLIEWPKDEPEPTKYFLSTLSATISRRALVNATKLRWRIEGDYQDLKQELGPGHYEGRGWRGFHHHATLCIAAYGYLVSERDAFPPREHAKPLSSRNIAFPKVTDPEDPQSGLNVTLRPRSQRSASSSPEPSRAISCVARAASEKSAVAIYDTVRLVPIPP